jgi:choline dehydrogenase-like flavoprotein
MCVGGSTVVNNAVCFDIPPGVLNRWNSDGYEAGLDATRLGESFLNVREWLQVVKQPEATANSGYVPFMAGIKAMGLDRKPYEAGAVDANIRDCLGCGNCNSGCPHGRKLSMLDHTLPKTQQRFGTEAVRVLAETQAVEILHDNQRATAVRCRMSDGRMIDVRANTVVVSAGAIASSVLLRRSRIGGPRVGTGLAFNLACPIVADLPDELRAGEGLQISHYLKVPGDGVALETWYQPLLGMALFMPGWFADHQRNMRRYSNMTAIGVVVGSDNGGTVGPSKLSKRAVAFDYKPSQRDLTLMVEGIKLASSGAARRGSCRRRSPTPSCATRPTWTRTSGRSATTATCRSTAPTPRAATRCQTTPRRASWTSTCASTTGTTSTSATRACSPPP